MRRPAILSVLGILFLAAIASAEPSFLRGVGAINLTGEADVQYVIRDLAPRGFNHIQAGISATDPATPRRLEALHKAGFTVYGYLTAFPDQVGLDGEYQIRADGTVKQGFVCPRSQKRLQQMVRQCLDLAKVGADGVCWDFITVESTEREACFCDKCVKALGEALGRPLTRPEAVAAIGDPATLLVWRRVREESTTAAIRFLCDGVHEGTKGAKRPFAVGGYVLGSHSDLGMDTGEMYKHLDVGAAMIYQAREAAPLGWMLRSLAGFQALGGRARNVVCVDTGFFVDEPWQELLTTSYDCIRGKAHGYCLWPFATISGDDLQAVTVLNRLDVAVFEPLRTGKAQQAAAGLRAFGRGLRDPKAAGVIAGLATRLTADPAYAYTDEFANALWPSLTAQIETELRALHAADTVVEMSPYRVQVAAGGAGAAISTADWALAWDAQSENIDQVVYRGLRGNAATGNANLGLLRARIIGWADLWGAHNKTEVTSRDARHITLRTSVRCDTCEIARTVTVRRNEPWLNVELSVRNLDTKPHAGRLWLWNGFGIPGMLERDPDNPWVDDVGELKDNTLTVSDEGCGLSIAADPADLRLGERGGDGCSHAYREISLKAGQAFTAHLTLKVWRRDGA